MSKVVGGLFGKAPKTTPSQQYGGFSALPSDLQEQYRGLLNRALGYSQDTAMFTPEGLSAEELQAQGIIQSGLDPAAIQSGVESFLNPYRSIVVDDLNRQFEGQFGALAQGASEAGAFGGSRYRRGQYDTERARLDAINSALSGQYNTAMGQFLGQRGQNISELLGFGGLRRGIDDQTRMAPISALNYGLGAYQPLLNAQQSTGPSTSGGSMGLLGGLSKAGEAASSVMGIAKLFSDRRLKENIKKVARHSNGLDIYRFDYKNGVKNMIGFMADEVEKMYPEMVSVVGGYKTVNYGGLI